MSVTEEIHADGLKNNLAEYLPVNENDENRSLKKTEASFLRESKGRFRDNFVESFLR